MPGKTTRGFRPGPIPPGRWFAELGLAAIAGRALGDADGRVAWRVEVEYSSDPAFADQPYRKARYSTEAQAQEGRLVHGRPARARGALGARRRHDARDVRLRVRRGQARLHHAHRLRHGLPLGRDRPLQDRPATCRALIGGHHLPRPHQQPGLRPLRRLPHRPGLRPRRRRRRDAAAARSPRAGSCATSAAPAASTQINHPTIFPSSNPLFALLCRGCPWTTPRRRRTTSWSTRSRSTRGRRRSARPRTRSPARAIDFYEQALAGGRTRPRSASATRTTPGAPTARPSRPSAGATAVYAKQLSEKGIRCAVKAGHTYAKIGGASARPCASRAACGARASRRSSATPARAQPEAEGRAATGGGVLQLLRDGTVIATGSGLDRAHRHASPAATACACRTARSPRPSARRSGSARPSAARSPRAAAERRAWLLGAARLSASISKTPRITSRWICTTERATRPTAHQRHPHNAGAPP